MMMMMMTMTTMTMTTTTFQPHSVCFQLSLDAALGNTHSCYNKDDIAKFVNSVRVSHQPAAVSRKCRSTSTETNEAETRAVAGRSLLMSAAASLASVRYDRPEEQ